MSTHHPKPSNSLRHSKSQWSVPFDLTKISSKYQDIKYKLWETGLIQFLNLFFQFLLSRLFSTGLSCFSGRKCYNLIVLIKSLPGLVLTNQAKKSEKAHQKRLTLLSTIVTRKRKRRNNQLKTRKIFSFITSSGILYLHLHSISVI